MRNRYIVCYDVADPKRLHKTYKKMNGYGDPVQYSVFQCELSDMELLYMQDDLKGILNLQEDRVLIVNTGPSGNAISKHISTMGAPLKSRGDSAIII